jgi:TRAP-type C4-dicarboxylate transport system permease small subunit
LPYLKKKMLRLFDYFTVLLMLFLLFIVFFQVLNRFILHIPLSWTEEAARYGFVWLSLFGAVKALQTGSHIKVDIFINNLKPKTVTIINLLAHDLITLIFSILFTYTGLDYAIRSINRTWQFGPVPIFPIYMALPITGILMAVVIIAESINRIKGIKSDEI